MDDNYVKTRSLVSAAKKMHLQQYFKQSNIVGMGFGKKRVNGRWTDELCAQIYVMKKVPKAFLPPSRLLPRKLYIGGDCIEVDVVETGPFHPLSFTSRERPAPSGISIGHFSITAGTLGCLVTDLTDGRMCILSNNHVLAAENAGLIGDAILQPGPFDGGVDPADRIATLKRFVMLNNPSPNTVDCAIAEVLNLADVIDQMKDNLMAVPSPNHRAVGLLFAGSCNSMIMNPIEQVLAQLNIQFLAGTGSTVAAELAMNVEKVGRTTEYTTGTITGIDATVTVGYGIGDLTFDNQILTAWMSDGGDSGSIVCEGGKGSNEDNCCGSSSAASRILQRNLKLDIALEKPFREEFLNRTLVGRFLIDTYFNNEDYIVDRANGAKIKAEDRSFAQSIYDKYIEKLRKVAVDPMKSKEKLDAKELKDVHAVVNRLMPYLKADEQAAAKQLLELTGKMEDKTASEILTMLNDKALYNQVVGIISSVSSLKKDCC